MGRRGKLKVDYFPHVTQTGMTMDILQSRWGNDGYAFWFKLLELLGNAQGFCYNCNSAPEWEYLLARTRVTAEVATAILDKLAEIEAIDAELWSEKWVWSDNFVAGVAPAFEKRKGELPHKPDFRSRNLGDSLVFVTEREAVEASTIFAGPETGKGEERKGEEIKGEERNGEETTLCPSKLRDGVEPQADTVYLKPSEVDRLRLEHGADGVRRLVEILDAYKTNHPKKCGEYQDDYKVITAWVVSRYREEQSRAEKAGAPGAARPSFAMAKLAALARAEVDDDPL